MTDSPLDLPDHWSDAAREAAEEILDARPGLSGADVAALEQAAELVALADRLGAVAAAAGYVSRSDAGAETTHRAVTGARLARTSAAAIFVPGSVDSARLSVARLADIVNCASRQRPVVVVDPRHCRYGQSVSHVVQCQLSTS